jgi:uncharacterized phiE125 gp8 family phage protein
VDGHIQIITPPATEPVSPGEVKLHARIDSDIDNTLITSWIKSGRELVEAYQRRALITQTIELTLDHFPECGEIYLPRSPLVSVTSFTYYDYANAATVWPLTNFIIDATSQPGRMALAYGIVWPSVTLRSINAIKVRFVAGYGAADDVPENVKDAIMLYCSYRNENRTGETGEVPKQFYDLLSHDRIYL